MMPIELKGGTVGSITHVESQLQGGADHAEPLLPGNCQANVPRYWHTRGLYTQVIFTGFAEQEFGWGDAAGQFKPHGVAVN